MGLSEIQYSVEEGNSIAVCAILGSKREVHLQSSVEVVIRTASDDSAEGMRHKHTPKWV